MDSAANEKLRLSIRNCEDHQFLPPEGVNVYDLLRHDTLVLSKDAGRRRSSEPGCRAHDRARSPEDGDAK